MMAIARRYPGRGCPPRYEQTAQTVAPRSHQRERRLGFRGDAHTNDSLSCARGRSLSGRHHSARTLGRPGPKGWASSPLLPSRAVPRSLSADSNRSKRLPVHDCHWAPAISTDLTSPDSDSTRESVSCERQPAAVRTGSPLRPEPIDCQALETRSLLPVLYGSFTPRRQQRMIQRWRHLPTIVSLLLLATTAPPALPSRGE
jgi:hypothetical protein